MERKTDTSAPNSPSWDSADSPLRLCPSRNLNPLAPSRKPPPNPTPPPLTLSFHFANPAIPPIERTLCHPPRAVEALYRHLQTTPSPPRLRPRPPTTLAQALTLSTTSYVAKGTGVRASKRERVSEWERDSCRKPSSYLQNHPSHSRAKASLVLPSGLDASGTLSCVPEGWLALTCYTPRQHTTRI